MARVVDVLDYLFGLPVTSGAVDVPEGRLCAPSDRTTLWRALRLRVVQLLYQTVIQPDRMPSMVHLNLSEGLKGQAAFLHPPEVEEALLCLIHHTVCGWTISVCQ